MKSNEEDTMPVSDQDSQDDVKEVSENCEEL
jgi:hypothetical protein